MDGGFGEIAAGVEMGTVLACVSLSALSDSALLDFVAAEYKQLAHQQARCFAALAEVGVRGRAYAESKGQSTTIGDRLAAEELSAELGWSSAYAANELAVAALLIQ